MTKESDDYERVLRDDVLARCRAAADALNNEAQRDALTVLQLSHTALAEGGLSSEKAKELARLAETLARRSSRAMPFAALARAAMATHHGHAADGRALLRECADKLALFGY